MNEKVEIITLKEAVEKYDIGETSEYDIIPFTSWYVMEFGLMTVIDYFSNKTEPLNEPYVLIIQVSDSGYLKLAKENGYYYKDGEILKEEK